jgi:hypothetical protein
MKKNSLFERLAKPAGITLAVVAMAYATIEFVVSVFYLGPPNGFFRW